MKNILLSIIVFFILSSCNEDGNLFVNNGVNGKWQLEATKLSPGSLVLEWTQVEDGEVYWFSSEGVYQNIDGAVTDEGDFLYNGEILTLSSNDGSNEIRFYVSFEDEKMILAFVGCIEECSYRYRRIG